MGMNHAGEIAPLSHLFDADIAIITNITDSHIGHFDNLHDIAHAKAEIFDGMTHGTAILPYDDDYFDLLRKAALSKGLRVISFGNQDGADLQLIAQLPDTHGQRLSIKKAHNAEIIDITIGLSAPHHSTTAMILLSCLHALDLSWHLAQSAFGQLREVTGRGNHQTIMLGGKSCLFIDDSYNAGPASMASALGYFATLPHHSKAIVLTDMLELGDTSDKAHEALIPLIEAIKPQTVILVGKAFAKIVPHITNAVNCLSYGAVAAAVESLIENLIGCDAVLIKGSNGSGAPQLAKILSSLPSSQDTNGGQHVS